MLCARQRKIGYYEAGEAYEKLPEAKRAPHDVPRSAEKKEEVVATLSDHLLRGDGETIEQMQHAEDPSAQVTKAYEHAYASAYEHTSGIRQRDCLLYDAESKDDVPRSAEKKEEVVATLSVHLLRGDGETIKQAHHAEDTIAQVKQAYEHTSGWHPPAGLPALRC
jgi:hypothetical protein